MHVFSNEPWLGVSAIVTLVGFAWWESQRRSSQLADLGMGWVSRVLLAPWNLAAAAYISLIVNGLPLLYLLFMLFLMLFLAHPKPGPPPGPELEASVGRLGVRAEVKVSDPAYWTWDQTNICIIHDSFRWWLAMASGVSYVLVPLRYLGWLSRGEIDALVARQLNRKKGMRDVISIAILAYGVITGFVVSRFHFSGRQNLQIAVALAVIEIVGLILAWPRVSLGSHLGAIRITGDAESYISSLSELSRLNKKPVSMALLQRIAKKTAVSPDRLNELAHPGMRPAADRYPIEQRYFRTGG